MLRIGKHFSLQKSELPTSPECIVGFEAMLAAQTCCCNFKRPSCEQASFLKLCNHSLNGQTDSSLSSLCLWIEKELSSLPRQTMLGLRRKGWFEGGGRVMGHDLPRGGAWWGAQHDCLLFISSRIKKRTRRTFYQSLSLSIYVGSTIPLYIAREYFEFNSVNATQPFGV